MRRSGTNAVGAPSAQFTLPVDVVNLCKAHGGVDTFDVDTGVLFCHDGTYCNEQSMVCSDNVGAAQACAAEVGMVWDAKLALCVVDNTNPFKSGAAKTACEKKNGYHWDTLLGCQLDQHVISQGDPCDVGGCAGEYGASGACEPYDATCKPAGPARSGNGPFPRDPCVVDGCPGEYAMNLTCVKDDPACHGGGLTDPDVECAKQGLVYSTMKKKCVPKPSSGQSGTGSSGGGGGSGLAIVGGLGLLATVIYAATRKKRT